MTTQAKTTGRSIARALIKADPNSPVLKVTGRDSIAIKAATSFDGDHFPEEIAVEMPSGGLEPGCDYGVICSAGSVPLAVKLMALPEEFCFAGFHFAPGGNAPARAGGDDVPAINPFSLWDADFRPACPDPRGMFLVDGPRRLEWLDIYKLGKNHLVDGTSQFGVTIADGNDPPQNPAGGSFDKLDYATAVAVMKHHGKTLAAVDTLFVAAYGVTERTAARRDPKVTGLDAPRTSKFGMMQATGNLWDWCHDGDPDEPRASVFGGSWLNDGHAGSRYANVATFWPDYSVEFLGARGRSDHLQPF